LVEHDICFDQVHHAFTWVKGIQMNLSEQEEKLILDVGSGFLNSHRLVPDALHCDVQLSNFVDVVCDIQHLPFKRGSFYRSYALHVLEHIDNPILALKELIRVTKSVTCVEVPHRFSLNARQDSSNRFDRHKCSFKPSWFHKVLRNYRHHLKTKHYFFGLLHIHVWIYIN